LFQTRAVACCRSFLSFSTFCCSRCGQVAHRIAMSSSDGDKTPKTGVFVRRGLGKIKHHDSASSGSLDCVVEYAPAFPARIGPVRSRPSRSGRSRQDPAAFKRRTDAVRSSSDSSLASPPPTPQPAPHVAVAPLCAPAPATRCTVAAPKRS
jgi:hypothetical protein